MKLGLTLGAVLAAPAQNVTEVAEPRAPDGSVMVLYNNIKKPYLKSFLIDYNAVVNPSFKFTMGEETNVEQSCSVVFRGRMFVLGSDEQKNQIAEVKDCALNALSEKLPFRFSSGSCTSVNEEAIVMCFDIYNQRTCHTWDLENFGFLEKHDLERIHSNVIYYKDQVIAAGGCESLDSCWNSVAAFDWPSQEWVEKADFPLPAYSGYAVTLTADKSALLYFGGVVQTKNPPTVKDVHRFKDNVWTKLGELNAVRAGHRVMNNQDEIMIIGGLHPRLIEICSYAGDSATCKVYEHLDDQLSYWPEPFLVADDYCTV